MNRKNRESEARIHRTSSLFAGMLIGGLAGAVTMLLLAPRSGQATRTQIQEKSIELRDQAHEMMGDAMAQVRKDRKKITLVTRQKAAELFEQGQALVAEKLENASTAVRSAEKAVQNL